MPHREPGALEIYADRVSRTSGAKALLIGAGSAMAALVAVGLGAAIPQEAIAALIGGAALSASIAKLISRARSRRRFATRVVRPNRASSAPDGALDGTPDRALDRAPDRALARAPDRALEPAPDSDIGARLRGKALADAAELASISWPLVAGAVVTPLLWMGLAAGLTTSFVQFTRALIEIGPPLALTLLALGIGTYSEARRLAKPRKSVKTQLVYPPLLLTAIASGLGGFAYRGLEGALAASVFMMFTASTFLTPGIWWARRKLRRERAALEKIALPARDDATDEARRWLEAAVACTDAPASSRAEALRGLAARFPISALEKVLDAALLSGEPPIVETALSLAHELRHRPPLDRLLALAENADAKDAAGAAIAALLPQLLRRYPDPRVEPALVALLARVTTPDSQIAAAEALGLVGSVESVEPLHVLRASPNAKLRAVVLEGIERIQIRHKRGQGGALSLSPEGDAGSVSLTPIEAGAVSIIRER